MVAAYVFARRPHVEANFSGGSPSTGVIVDKRNVSANPQTQIVAERLTSKFTEEDGVVSAQEVDDIVRESVDSLEDAPVQTFVPLIAEHKASERLRELIRERAGSTASTS
jgi:intergrase/recombinase